MGNTNSLANLQKKLEPIYNKKLYLEIKIDKESLCEYDDYYTFIGTLEKNTHIKPTKSTRDLKVKVYLPKKYKPKVSIKDIETFGLTGKINKFPSFHNPANRDYEQHNLLKSIIGKVKIDNSAITFKFRKTKSKQFCFSGFIDSHFSNLSKFIPDNQLAILRTLVVRPDAKLSEEIYKDFSKTGLIHILCISGTHLSIISLASYHFFKSFLGEILSAYLTLIFSWVYISITSMGVPILRAGLLNTLLVLGVIIHRRAFLPTGFAFITIIFLAYNPLFMLDTTFQLSFLATASLIFLYPQLEKFGQLLQWRKGLWAPIASILSVQLAILPIILLNFHRISLTLFFSNFILLPVFQIVIVGIFFSSFLIYLLYPLGKVLIVVVSIILNLAINVNEFFADNINLNIYTGNIPITMFWLYYLALLGVFIKAPSKTVAKFNKMVFGAILCGLLFFSSRNDYLAQVHFIDVAQGDACLIISKNKKSVLIDTGGLEYSRLDMGETVIIPYLHYYGIESLDYLILSHDHFDHIGGSIALAKEIPIKNLILASKDSKDNDYVKRLLFFASGTNLIIPGANEIINLDNLNLKFVHCPVEQNKNTNDSLVVKVSVGEHKLLFTGDISSKLEQNLGINDDRISLLKVAHHGSRNSTSQEFLKIIRPQIAVISVGAKNPFGHPHNETLLRLTLANSKIYRTDISGAITVNFVKNKIIVHEYLKH